MNEELAADLINRHARSLLNRAEIMRPLTKRMAIWLIRMQPFFGRVEEGSLGGDGGQGSLVKRGPS